MEWQSAFGGSKMDWANAVRETTDSGYIVVGQTDSFDNSDSFDNILIDG